VRDLQRIGTDATLEYRPKQERGIDSIVPTILEAEEGCRCGIAQAKADDMSWFGAGVVVASRRDSVYKWRTRAERGGGSSGGRLLIGLTRGHSTRNRDNPPESYSHPYPQNHDAPSELRRAIGTSERVLFYDHQRTSGRR
jgi:hypothetical protein